MVSPPMRAIESELGSEHMTQLGAVWKPSEERWPHKAQKAQKGNSLLRIKGKMPMQLTVSTRCPEIKVRVTN
jgi:hypothetical protein